MTEYDMTLAAAIRAGWEPRPIREPQTIRCQAGCGRAIVVDRRENVTGFICKPCRQSYGGFLARQRRARKSPQKPAETPAGPTGPRADRPPDDETG